jgi:ABC-type antimicrobial peptide transport system permease subunit
MELFAMLLLVVAFICLLLLVNYGYGNIRKRYQEIGIMKALGASTKSVGFIFGLQTILAGIVISVISTLMLIFLCNPINQQLSNRMLEFIGNTELGALEILKPNVITIIINICVISVITAISSVFPIRKIHKIKPRQIINNK